MASLTIPDNVFQWVADRARKHGLSIEEQAANDLARASQEELNEASLIEEIRKSREASPDIFITEKDLQEAKRWGRE